MNEQVAYKIVEIVDNKIRTLFHGLHGSRTVPYSEWLEADVKMGRDGSGDRYYLTGWHTLPTKEEAFKYLERFKSRTDILKVVECTIRDTWRKEHSPHPVILSRYIKFNELVDG